MLSITAANGVTPNATQTFTLTVDQATTSSVSSSLNPSTYGQSVVFTATVTNTDAGGGVPTGTVAFFDGMTSLGAGTTLSGSGISATSTFTISTLAATDHSITAQYTASGSFLNSTSSILTQTVDPATLTATIIDDPTKSYDGTEAAALTAADFSLTGLATGESFTVTQTAGAYNSQDVSIASTVTASLAAGDFTAGSGTLASNYILPTTASGGGQITAAILLASIIGDPSKSYDAADTAVLTSANFSLSGVATGESFTVTQTAGTYNSPNVASATTVIASLADGDFSPGDGTTVSNYVLPTTASGDGQITPVTLTASIVGVPSKSYDGTTSATLTSANFSLTGFIGDESLAVTQTAGTYNSRNVTSATTVTATLAAGDFTDGPETLASNYTLPTSASGDGQITIATVMASIIDDPSKIYDSTDTATLTPANFSLSGLGTGDSFTITQTSGTYNSPDVTSATTITASLAAGDFTPGDGTLASNYTLPTTASGDGQITPVTLSALIMGDPIKPYDGTTAATLTSANFSLSGFVGMESLTVTQTAGTYNSPNVVSATTVTASLTAGDFTPADGSLASNYTLPTTASGPGQITVATLTASIIDDPTKPYDGTNSATLTSLNFDLSGLATGETFTVTQTAGTYNNPNVALAATVTASLVAGDFTPADGTLASNYTLPTSASGDGQITALTLTASIIGDPTKSYDGTSGTTLTSANFSLSGFVPMESMTVTQTAGTYNSPNVPSATTVTASLAPAEFTDGSGTLASNYILPNTASGPGQITAATLTASIIGDPTKPYDGTDSATLISSNFNISGLVTGETFTVTQTAGTYNSPDVLSATTVTASLAPGDFTDGPGTLASNYTLPIIASGPGQITALNLTASIIGDPTKPYDGTDSATLISSNFSLSGFVGMECLTVTQTVGAYDSPNVFSATTVTASLAPAEFTDGPETLASNYILPTTASGPGLITAATLTASIVDDPTRSYDGTDAATLTSLDFSLAGLVTGESFTVTQTAGTYNSPNVLSATTVTASLAAGDFTDGPGTLASNYTLPTTASGDGLITVATLTASIVNDPNKPYDGTNIATLTPLNFSLSGLATGESFTVTQTTGSYNSPNVTTATTVTSNLAPGDFTDGDGTLASNYILPTTASGDGQITPAPLIITAASDTKVYDGTNSSSQTPTYTGTLFNDDTLTGLTQAFASISALGAGASLLVVTGYSLTDDDGGNDYAVSTVDASGTITQAFLTITADDQFKLDGAPVPPLTASYTGFVNDESSTNLTTEPTLTTMATADSPVDTYPITASGAVDANYNISYVAGTLTVNPAIIISPSTLPVATVGVAYSQQLTASGGSGGFTFSATGLPPGLSLSTVGLLSGTPTTALGIPFNLNVTLTDSDSETASRAYPLTVLAATASGAVDSSLAESFYGEMVTLSATFTATPAGSAPMTGTVTFYDGSTSLGTEPLVADGPDAVFAAIMIVPDVSQSVSGTSSLSTSALTAGNHNITAVYSGDANYSTSSSQTAVSVHVSPAVTSVGLTASTTPAGTVLTSTVVVTSPGNPLVVGNVSFYDGTTLLGTAPLSNGIATLNVGTVSAGSHSFRAVFFGAGTFAVSQSPVVSADGPGLTGVARYGYHAQPTYLLLDFNGPLDPTTAQNVSNYHILGPAGHRIKVISAIYDPATHTVTVVPVERLNIHRKYRLTVNGTAPSGLSNPSGVLLDGAGNGQPGSNYVASLTWRNLAGRARTLPTLGLLDAARPRLATRRMSAQYARATLQTSSRDGMLTDSSHVRWAHHARR